MRPKSGQDLAEIGPTNPGLFWSISATTPGKGWPNSTELGPNRSNLATTPAKFGGFRARLADLCRIYANSRHTWPEFDRI